MGVGKETKECNTGLLASVLSQWVPQVTQTISSALGRSQAILSVNYHAPSPHPQPPAINLQASLSPQSWPLSQKSRIHHLSLGEHQELLCQNRDLRDYLTTWSPDLGSNLKRVRLEMES